MLQWTETAGEHHAEGFYGRKFCIFPEGDRWRAEARCMTSRLYPSVGAAKEACEERETEMRKG